ANRQSTAFLSETEQYLSIVRALYPAPDASSGLTMLREEFSPRIQALAPERKYVIYPGCDSRTPSKRWPYFKELIEELGSDNVIVVGGGDDLNYEYAYYYPAWITSVLPGSLLRKARV